jgi:hypothetical protein
MNANSLLNLIELRELTYEATSLFAWEIGVEDNIDDVAKYMWKGGAVHPQASARPPNRIRLSEDDPRPDKKYWTFVKLEMRELLCNENKKYDDLWRKIEELKTKSTRSIVGTIAGYIGAKFGVEAALLTGFVAVCLYGATKVSKEAFCEQLKENNA